MVKVIESSCVVCMCLRGEKTWDRPPGSRIRDGMMTF